MKKASKLLVIIAILCCVLLLAACGGGSDTPAPDNNGECTHQYAKWAVTKNATCTGEGIQSRTCDKCGYIETQSLPALGHTLVVDKAVKATCTTTGLTEGKHCSVCNETTVAQEDIPALGHTEETDAGRSATCTTTGLTEGKHCTVCNKVLVAQQTIPALGHTEVIDQPAKAATCTEPGATEQKHCSVCNTVLSTQTQIPATGHTEVVDEAAKNPTCTDAGWTKGSHCSVCNVVLSEKKIVEAIGHVEATDRAKAPTCTTTGLTEGKHCSVCNYVIVPQESIPAKGHTVVTDEAVAATCSTTGLTEGSHCSVCNTILVAQTQIAKTAHAYVEGVCTACGHEDPTYIKKTSIPEVIRIASAMENHGAATTAKYYVEGYVTQITNPIFGNLYITDAEGNTLLIYGLYNSTGSTRFDSMPSSIKPKVGDKVLLWGVLKNYDGAEMVNAWLMERHTHTHTYEKGVCAECGANDPNYTPVYNANETWVVNGQWEFSLVSAEEHNHCSSFLTNNYGFSDEQIVMLTFKYKNIGYGETFSPKITSIIVVDDAGEMAKLYSSTTSSVIGCDHAIKPSGCINGLVSRMSLPYALNNKSTSVTIIVSFEDSNKVTRKAQFTTTIIPKADDTEEKLEGCTFNLDFSLPKTISYYTYTGSIQSSCSVTGVEFEVSGDDLYIYFTGRKTYDSRGSGQSDSCKIGWKLYDSNNNVIADGTAYTLSLAMGEGFVKTKTTAYNCITPGETYKLVILNVN